MEGTIALLDGGGGGGGCSGASSKESAVSKVEKDYMGTASEVSSYQEESELELGLGLSIGCRGGGGNSGVKSTAWGECGRILTAKDFPSVVSQRTKTSAAIAVSGTKRAADSVPHEGGSPPSSSQVVGWPPVRQHRLNSLVNHAKAQRSEDQKLTGEKDKSKEVLAKKNFNGDKAESAVRDKGHLALVKVNMDGIRIGRKVDLNAHSGYETLAQTIEDMFFKPGKTISSVGGGDESSTKISRLLNGCSDFVLTYEDKEGDWMLVGDVPWGMFLSTVRRLRIMKTSEANGLAPDFQDTSRRPRGKPI